MTAQSVFAQGFVSKDRDGATTYSNQPLEAARTSGQVQVNPSGAEVTTYLLSGATLEEAQKDAALKAPFDQSSGKRVWGKTTWTAAWNYWTKQEKESCRMDVVSVRLRVTTQLPAWSVPKDGPAVDQCRWDLFAKSLRRQEDVRAAAVLARGREIERAILALSSRPGCESFATEVAALAQKLVEDGKPRVAPPVQPLVPAGTLTPKPVPRSPSRAAAPVVAKPPAPPAPLPIPRSIIDACQG